MKNESPVLPAAAPSPAVKGSEPPVPETKNDFTKGKVSSAILRMAIPLTIAQMVAVLYNIVDRMYIGHLSDPLAFAGLGLALPAVMLVSAFSNLYGGGGAPLCSIERGRGDLARAARIQGNAFALLLGTGVLLTALGLLFLRPLLFLLGASENTYPFAGAYLRIYLLGTVFVMISQGMNSFINSQGFSRVGMVTVLIGALLNLVLDPLFIFVLDMGVQGAALATVLSQAVSAAWVLLFLRGRRVILRLSLRDMRLEGKIVGRIFGLGLTGFIMMGTNAIVSAVGNNQLRRFGGDLYVGVMTALTTVHEVAVMVVQGVTHGAQPVLGYNYGAGRGDRVKQGVRFISAVSVLYALLVWALLMLLPGAVMRLMGGRGELLEAGRRAMRIYFCAFPFMSLQFAGQSTFVGLGRARPAMFFSLLRKIFLVTTLMLLLPPLWGLGADGVYLAEPISNVVGGSACYLTMYFTVYRKLKRTDTEVSP